MKRLKSIYLDLHKTKKPKKELFVFLFFVILGTIMAWPLILRCTDYIPSGSTLNINLSMSNKQLFINDWWVSIWNFWFLKKFGLGLFFNGFYTDYIFYPVGTTLIFHGLTFSNFLIGLPLILLSKYAAAYNFSFFVSMIFSAFGTYKLAHYLTKNRLASIVAGTIFGFSPFIFAHLLDGQLMYASLLWIPFYVLYLIKFLDNPSRKNAIIFGLLLFLTVLIDFNFIVIIGLFSLVYILYKTIHSKAEIFKNCQLFINLFLALNIFLILFSPFLLPMITNISFLSEYTKDASYLNAASIQKSNLLSFFVPQSFHPLWGKFFEGINAGFSGITANKTAYLGFIPLTIALVGIKKYYRKTIFWIISFVISIVLSLGTTLSIGSFDTKIPLPFSLFRFIPGLDNFRIPSRFSLITYLSLAILAAFGTKYLIEGKCKKRKTLIAFIVVVLIAIEYMFIPLPLLKIDIPNAHKWLAENKLNGNLLVLPIHIADGKRIIGSSFNYYDQYLQVFHERKTENGYISRVSEKTINNFTDIPLYKDLLGRENGNIVSDLDVDLNKKYPQVSGKAYYKDFLQKQKIRFILIDKRFLGNYKNILKHIVEEPKFEDEKYIIYQAY